MASKHLTEDEIRYTVDVKTADAQKAIYTLEQQSKKLRSENKARLSQMISLEAAGRKESEAYRNLKKQYSETSKEIRSLTSRISEQTSQINILDMSMVQLKKTAEKPAEGDGQYREVTQSGGLWCAGTAPDGREFPYLRTEAECQESRRTCIR